MNRRLINVVTTWAFTIGISWSLIFPPNVSAYEDALVRETVSLGPSREPVLDHPKQAAEAQKKLNALSSKKGRRPNIVVVLMDDIGWGDIGVYGGGIAVGAPTPNIDRLARSGLRLTSTYSQPSCSPTRATLLTGRLPRRHGLLRPPMAGEKGGLEGEITMAELLRESNYVTQAVGKWHLGENEASQPQNVGFDDFYGFLGVANMYTEWRDPAFQPDIVNKPERQEWMRNVAFNRFLVHGERGKKLKQVREIDLEVFKQLDEEWAEYSSKFIHRMKNSDEPFFLYHATTGAHFDNYPPDKFKGMSPAGYPYKDVVVQLDDIVGRLVKALEETGQLENTLIFVTSDNGPEMETWWDSGYTPFRGAKGSTYEGGVRVPGIAYWKGMIAPGRESDGLFDMADIFATSLSLAGVPEKVPSDRFIDSIDQTSFLLSDSGESNRKFLYYWLADTFSAVRVGEYKFMTAGIDNGVPNDSWNAGGFTGVEQKYKYGKVFNLYLDPKETHNFLLRKLPYISIWQNAIFAHMETFKRYPPKVVVRPPGATDD
ncbi:arylsulfatase [Halioxenophilus sp. WMMB6]|uniref:arylsulfatase n=1 Tax=Halioxenophilus sp. WMMB6 TaxID=3073815 RepID=UPI00295EFE4E|nr:arylsulfatase [Halioxenophilus sp. WMMB6]